jgi:hypothetical protein
LSTQGWIWRRRAVRLAAVGVCSLATALVFVAAAGSAARTGLPPLGRYNCYQFDPYSGYLPSGWFKLLSTRTYVLYTKRGGRYSYNGTTRKVTWLSGPYKNYGWVGEYLPRGFKGRKGAAIVLKDRKNGLTITCNWEKPGT